MLFCFGICWEPHRPGIGVKTNFQLIARSGTSQAVHWKGTMEHCRVSGVRGFNMSFLTNDVPPGKLSETPSEGDAK